jgi:LysR family glycine cleavage system transcriptional activator
MEPTNDVPSGVCLDFLMDRPLPPLNSLRAFEASARHLSMTRAAAELHVTPAALSHQIAGLESFLGVKLFNRRARSITLTPAGEYLYPGLHSAFLQIRQTLAGLDRTRGERVLVVSAAPGFTAKWLAPRLYRFLSAHPDIDVRISSTITIVDFVADGVDVALRNMAIDQPDDPDLVREKLVELTMVPVCSPKLLDSTGPLEPKDLKRLALIHDDSLNGRANIPSWVDWLEAAGVRGVAVSRGLRFNSADHALEATVEGAGVLLAHRILAYDDLRTGRLIAPFDLELPTGRAFHFVCPKATAQRPSVKAFRDWIRGELRKIDLKPPAAVV